MPPPSVLSGKKWSDLPTNLQSHILSFLSKQQRNRLLKLSLDTAETIITMLPEELLPVAQASADLSAVVADVLGSRAAYLTTSITHGKLAQWVTALGPVVKAVSTWDEELQEAENDACRPNGTIPYGSQTLFDKLRRNAIDLFKALSTIRVRLAVLDLRNVPFYNAREVTKDLLSGLVTVLTQSSGSLKELALPVTGLCAKALGRVSLKRLDVCELHLREVDGNRDVLRATRGRSAEVFMEMLAALDGHADRSQKASTLRELRLTQVHEAPCIDPEESQYGSVTGLFNAVRKLRVKVLAFSNLEHTVTLFICLFPNLESLDWNGTVSWKHLQTINGACPKMQEFHFRPNIGLMFCRAAFSFTEPDPLGLELALTASQGRLRTLILSDQLSTEQMKVLGESCPRLEHLAIEIGSVQIGGLASLLGTHCRQMRKLEITLPSIGVEGWRTLTDAVRSASDELCEVALRRCLCDYSMDPIETVVQSFLDVIEFLGDRARSMVFELFTLECEYEEMVISMCRMLRACATHTQMLEYLEAGWMVKRPPHVWDYDSDGDLLMLFEREKRNLLTQAPRLHFLLLGQVYLEAMKRLEEILVA